MTRAYILPVPGIINRLRMLTGCRRLRIIDESTASSLMDRASMYIDAVGIGVSGYYNEGLRLAELLGLDRCVAASSMILLGLVYQLPFSAYYLLYNTGYRFRGYNPIHCPGYVISDDAPDPGIRVSETPLGVLFMAGTDGESVVVEPQVLDAYSTLITGFSYTLIDELVGKGFIDELVEVLRRHGTHVYHYYCMALIKEIARSLGGNELCSIVVGSRLKKIYGYAWKTIQLFKSLALRKPMG